MLGLKYAGKELLSSSQFTRFTQFTDAYHAKNPSIEMTTLSIVRAHFDDFDVAKMILVAEKMPGAQGAGKRMEGVLFKDWMTSPYEVFKKLKLDQVKPLELFESPMFVYWMKFMDDFAETFPSKKTAGAMLAATYKDKDLINMIEAVQKNPKTSDFGNKGTRWRL